MLSAKWRATWLMGSHQWIQASLSMFRPLQTGQHKVTKRIIWFINISKLFLIVSHYSFIAQMFNQQNQEKTSPFCPQSNQWRLSLMASLIRSVRITAATILSLSMVSKGSNENPTFFWSHLVDAIEIQISFGVWSHLWQPGQSSMGVSMTCSWSTGALWHWVTHKTTVCRQIVRKTNCTDCFFALISLGQTVRRQIVRTALIRGGQIVRID